MSLPTDQKAFDRFWSDFHSPEFQRQLDVYVRSPLADLITESRTTSQMRRWNGYDPGWRREHETFRFDSASKSKVTDTVANAEISVSSAVYTQVAPLLFSIDQSSLWEDSRLMSSWFNILSRYWGLRLSTLRSGRIEPSSLL